MAEKWNTKWDGQPKPHLTLRERMQGAREVEEGKRREHERRLEEDANYRAKWDKEQAKKSAKESAAQAKKEDKKLARLRKHGVFDVVVPEGSDGERHCPRCGRTSFTRRRLHSPKFHERAGLIAGPIKAALGKPHMICEHCGAAYPLAWGTWDPPF